MTEDLDRAAIIAEAERYARGKLAGDFSGHDWQHADRVRNSALAIAKEEGADLFICELAALLHDVADGKLVEDEERALREMRDWLLERGLPEPTVRHVLEIVSTLSFKGGSGPPMRTPEGKVVQDADRLDAIGAIGISRVFAYSGAKSRPIHVPGLKPRTSMTLEEYRSRNGTAINHFHEKLLKLRDLMNTAAARRLADGRHAFMEKFLEQFHAEWDGRK